MRYKLRNFFATSAAAATRALNFLGYLFPKFVTCVNVYFLRKTNTFIKSKYSKNRQWSKSIVYFGLWFGVISAFAVTYYTYRFMFVLSYLWWLPATLVTAVAVTHCYKQRKFITANFISFWRGFMS